MSDNLDSVMRRIQKLLAIANDGRADANEASAAAGMAEKLMRKYQLDNADLVAAELKSKAGAISFAHVFANMKRDDPRRPPLVRTPCWAQHLAVAVARLHDCEARQNFANSQRNVMEACLTFYGYKADVQVAQFTFDYLVGTLIRAMKNFNAERRDGGKASKSSSEAYRRGFTGALLMRMMEQAADKSVELQHSSASRDLVVVKKAAIEEQFGAFKYRETKQQEVRDREAFRNGVRDGKQVDINRRGLGGETDQTLLLSQ